MAKVYGLAVFIGRFQPFHLGHESIIKHGLEVADSVLVLVGSSDSPRCHRNPFLLWERSSMILDVFKGNDRVYVEPLSDSNYNDSHWITEVQEIVSRYQGDLNNKPVCLIGHKKDSTSYYLKMFPQWESVDSPNYKNINSTDIRASYFSNIGHMWINDAQSLVPKQVKNFLKRFMDEYSYNKIKDEYEFIVKYKSAWANSPYPPTFVTVDAVVVQSGHILLVKRGAQPGLGQWALPGGFVNQDERIADAVIRELREETGIKVPDPVLRGSIVAREVFDDPYRSARGRTITHVSLIKLKDDLTLPRVKGGDDAAKATWIPLTDLYASDFFEDHFAIIQNMLGRI
jgi:bifunctional NMN adenylyltransferase/nudix hydrolase